MINIKNYKFHWTVSPYSIMAVGIGVVFSYSVFVIFITK